MLLNAFIAKPKPVIVDIGDFGTSTTTTKKGKTVIEIQEKTTKAHRTKG